MSKLMLELNQNKTSIPMILRFPTPTNYLEMNLEQQEQNYIELAGHCFLALPAVSMVGYVMSRGSCCPFSACLYS